MEQNERHDLQKCCEAELESIISLYLAKLDEENVGSLSLYQELVDAGFIYITAPKEDRPMMSFLTMDSLKNYYGGRSIKSGNIRLNINTLVSSIPEFTVSAFGIATDAPILKVCAALEIWKTIRDICTVNISKDQAFVIVALWKNCDYYHQITTESGFKASVKLYQQYGEPSISSIKYNHILDSLLDIECIEIEEDVIWLREWISKNYIDSL